MKKLVLNLLFLFTFIFVTSSGVVAQKGNDINNVKTLQQQITSAIREYDFEIEDEKVKAQMEQGLKLLDDVEQKYQANGGDLLDEEWLTWKKITIITIILVVTGVVIYGAYSIYSNERARRYYEKNSRDFNRRWNESEARFNLRWDESEADFKRHCEGFDRQFDRFN